MTDPHSHGQRTAWHPLGKSHPVLYPPLVGPQIASRQMVSQRGVSMSLCSQFENRSQRIASMGPGRPTGLGHHGAGWPGRCSHSRPSREHRSGSRGMQGVLRFFCISRRRRDENFQIWIIFLSFYLKSEAGFGSVIQVGPYFPTILYHHVGTPSPPWRGLLREGAFIASPVVSLCAHNNACSQ